MDCKNQTGHYYLRYILVSKVKSANVKDLLDANKVIKRVKSESVKLKLLNLLFTIQ